MSKIKKINYTYMNWGPFVMKTKVPEYITNKLKVDGKKTKTSYNYSLAGHLKNQFLYNNDIQKWFYDETQPIFQAYRDGHCKYHGIEKLDVELQADDLWVNFMKAGDFNPMHIHGADYSFVLFVDVPKALQKEQKEFEGTSAKPGTLMFEYTQQARPRYATTGMVVYPEPGDMYIFPALLQHCEAPFKSKVTRISVSGNLRIVNWDKLPKNYF